MIFDVDNHTLLLTSIGECELVGNIVQREFNSIGIVACSIEVKDGSRTLCVLHTSHLFPVAGTIGGVGTRHTVENDFRGFGSLRHENGILGTVT